jgi:hypothetical protein
MPPMTWEEMLMQYLGILEGSGQMPVTLSPVNAEAIYASSTPPGAPPGVGTDFDVEDGGFAPDYSKNRTQWSGTNTAIADAITAARIGPEARSPFAFQSVPVPVDTGMQQAYSSYVRSLEQGGLEGLVASAALSGIPMSQTASYVQTLASLPEYGTEGSEEAWNAAIQLTGDPEQLMSDWQQVSGSLAGYAFPLRLDPIDQGVMAQSPELLAPANPGVPQGWGLDAGALRDAVADTYEAAVTARPLVEGIDTGQYTVGPNGELMALEPSALMKKFDDLGIPYPTERYGEGRYGVPVRDFEPLGEDYDQARGQLDRYLSQLSRQRGSSFDYQPPSSEVAQKTIQQLQGRASIPDMRRTPGQDEYRQRMASRDRNVPSSGMAGGRSAASLTNSGDALPSPDYDSLPAGPGLPSWLRDVGEWGSRNVGSLGVGRGILDAFWDAGNESDVGTGGGGGLDQEAAVRAILAKRFGNSLQDSNPSWIRSPGAGAAPRVTSEQRMQYNRQRDTSRKAVRDWWDNDAMTYSRAKQLNNQGRTPTQDVLRATLQGLTLGGVVPGY